MKYLSILLFTLSSLWTIAQEPTYTPMKGNYKFKGIKVDTLFLVPSFSDTASANATKLDSIAGAMIRCGNDFYMRNASLNAWLQNVNVGNGASPVTQFVDTIYRKAGKDSIYWRKGGITRQFKDSTGGGGTDSPDRIDGSATQNVKANMQDFNLIFDNVDTFFLINSNKSIILTNERITIDNYSQATTKTKGDLQFTQSRQIDLSSVSDTIYIPGTYVITNSGQPLYFKEPSRLPGQIIHVINRTGSPVDIYSLSGDIIDQTGGIPGNIQPDKFAILSSDGADWWIFNAN